MSFLMLILFHYDSPCSYITRGMNSRLVGGRSSETHYYLIDMKIIKEWGSSVSTLGTQDRLTAEENSFPILLTCVQNYARKYSEKETFWKNEM
jgi:hypothetical protein